MNTPSARDFKRSDAVPPTMPKITLSEKTVDRLDGLREDDESYDEIVTELVNIYEAEELTMFHSGDG